MDLTPRRAGFLTGTVSVMLGVLLLASGCSGQRAGREASDIEREQALGRALGVDPSPIRGILQIDSVTEVVQARNGSGMVLCTVPGLAGGLGQAAQPVVITAPDGREIALGRLDAGEPSTVRDPRRRRSVAVPGTRSFEWSARPDEPLAAGVYTAAVPELDVEARFTTERAKRVRLRYDS